MAVTTGIDRLFNNADTEVYKVRAKMNAAGTAVNEATTSVVSGASKAPSAAPKDDMGKSDFLLLLVTQMRYQDPMSPMDNTEFVSQLAQFRALEGNVNIEKAVTKMSDSLSSTADAQKGSAAAMSNAAAITLIGKEVMVRRHTVSWETGSREPAIVRVHVGRSASAVVEILDADGAVIRTLTTGAKDSYGNAFVTWDGLNDQGKAQMGGEYKIRIKDEALHPDQYAFAQDIAQGVRFSGQDAYVRLSGGELDMKDLMDVSAPAPTSDYGSLSPSSAIALLGKQVRVLEQNVTVKGSDGEKIPIRVNLGSLPQATVNVVDAHGQVVATLKALPAGNGSGYVEWDCRNSTNQNFVGAGQYSLQIAGQDRYPFLFAYTDGMVEGISNIGGGTLLRVGGRLVSIEQILEVGIPAAPQEADA